MVEQITRYKISNGREFETKAEAYKEELKLSIFDKLKEHDPFNPDKTINGIVSDYEFLEQISFYYQRFIDTEC